MSNLDIMLTDSMQFVHQAAWDVFGSSLSFEKALQEPLVMTVTQGTPSFMKRVLAAHSVNRATEDIICNLAEKDSDATENQLAPISKSYAKPLPRMRGEIEHILAALGVMMKTDVEAVVKTP